MAKRTWGVSVSGCDAIRRATAYRQDHPRPRCYRTRDDEVKIAKDAAWG